MYVISKSRPASGLLIGRRGNRYQPVQASPPSNCQTVAPLRKHTAFRGHVRIYAALHGYDAYSTGSLHGAQRMQRMQSLQADYHQGQYKRHIACRVLTESTQLTIGTTAPEFQLPEPLTGKLVSLSAAAAGATATLVMFICNHCPFVVLLKPAIAALAKEYQAKGVTVIAISSNSIKTHPQDGPEKMAQDATTQGYSFPYLYDESQSVAKAYEAACTPEFYVFDKNLKLTYHGQFDDARPNNGKEVTGADLRVALDAAIAGSELPTGFEPKPSIGCNIKWHHGNEPVY